jgi:hypothetical protein
MIPQKSQKAGEPKNHKMFIKFHSHMYQIPPGKRTFLGYNNQIGSVLF